MAKIIAVALRKGGAGKTTTAVNMASEIAKRDYKTLLIDLDPSANATKDSGFPTTQTSLSHVLNEGLDIQSAIYQTKYSYDILVSDEKLGLIERGLGPLDMLVLKDLIKPLKKRYDYIIIDTGPTDGALVNNGLCAADHVLITMQCLSLALDGVETTLKAINKIKRLYNKGLTVLGILPTLYNTRGSISEAMVSELEDLYPSLKLPFYIKYSTHIGEASSYHMPLGHYNTTALKYSGYDVLADYIIKETSK